MEKEESKNQIPRIVIAAEKSGCGKTTFTCGLLQVLLNRGVRPLSFKCGPDYIDPLFHKRVLGVESNNLDAFFQSPDEIRAIVEDSFCENKSVAVVEGVMGIYDGLSPASLKGSCYEISQITQSRILLLADAQGVGRTLISRIKGILSEDVSGLIRGVVLNRISEGYYGKIKPVLEKELSEGGYNVRVLGFLPNEPQISIDSRHLGLMLPGEVTDLKERISRTADLMEKYCDVDGILALMQEDADAEADHNNNNINNNNINNSSNNNSSNNDIYSNTGSAGSADPAVSESTASSLHLAVAKDEAFCFYYRENLKAFERAGVKISYFSPIHDARIPEDADALLFGGGYPENNAKELSENTSMLASVRAAIASGMPSLAECGGFLYLHKALKTADGRIRPMAGVIDATAEYTGHSVRFGYLEVKENKTPYFPGLTGLRGHEFHYFESSENGSDCILQKASTGKEYDSLIVKENSVWGFAHFYYPSRPEFVDAFVRAMHDYKNSRAAAEDAVSHTYAGFNSGARAEFNTILNTESASDSNTETTEEKTEIVAAAVSTNSARFFANHACEYYPCHKCSVEINCLFCYCPLYHLDCPGNYTVKEIDGKLIKNCKDCVFPHLQQNYDKVIRILRESQSNE